MSTTLQEHTSPARGTSPARLRNPRHKHRHNKVAYLFLAPWLLGLFLITLGPMLASLYLSFTDFHLLASGPRWTGLANYVRMLTEDERFRQSASVTFRYVFLSVPLQLAFALVLAVVLDKGVRGLALYRSIYYLPSLLGSSVAVALMWRQVFGGSGLLNRVLGALGFENLPSWIAHPSHALSTLIVLNVWTFGAPMIIFLAGLRQIPNEYYQAAAVDGAGTFTKFFRITLPLLTPVIFFNLVLQVIQAFQAFTPAFIISGGKGGPSDSTLFYTLYLYQQGFSRFDMGYASAMAWMLLLAVAGFTAVKFLTAKYWVHYAD